MSLLSYGCRTTGADPGSSGLHTDLVKEGGTWMLVADHGGEIDDD